MFIRLTDRQILYLMAIVSGASLVCYTAVLRLCGLEAHEHQPARAEQRNRLANVAHLLDWLMNALVATVGIGRLYREENFGGQHQPRWLKIYFMVTGPLPTIGMVGAMVTGHRWGSRLGTDPRRRRIHRALAWLGYTSWWLSYLPIFAQPLLNKRFLEEAASGRVPGFDVSSAEREGRPSLKSPSFPRFECGKRSLQVLSKGARAMTTTNAQSRCFPTCSCMDDDQALADAMERAYDMVFKGTVDFFVIKAAYDLNLFETMAGGPQPLTSLAEATGTVPPRLERLLITMEQVGLARSVEGAWGLTPFAEQFFSAPEQHRNMTMVPFVSYMADLIQTYYANLADVTRGKMDFTSHVPHPPKTREDSIFYETIHRSNIHFVQKFLRDNANLEGVGHLIDVGGGIGDIAASLCHKHPELRVTLINLPSALELVRENAAARGLAERITPVSVDMYREPYPQGDAVLFARILYPMNRQFSTLLLKKAYDALPSGGRVLILDMIISDPEKPNYDYLTHYLCGIGMNFSVLEFKDHGMYPGLLRELGFGEVSVAEGYDHVLYQAVKQ